MRYRILIFYSLLSFAPVLVSAQENKLHLHFDFLDDTIDIITDSTVIIEYAGPLSEESIATFYASINSSDYVPIIDGILAYKVKNRLSDWLYYQLIRKTAQQIAPKADNYLRYTLYKWFFLSKSGYDTRLAIGNNELLFYVYSNENIYDVPLFYENNRQYVCLNSHDYGKINLDKDTLHEVAIQIPGAQNAFSYKITAMPDFKASDYSEKDLKFSFRNKPYSFKVMINPQLQTLFNNYPIVDFESYFNIPLTKETYRSLMPKLKENIRGLSQKKGIDYLMQFTRYAFLYETDQDNFGKEKRLSPELTLLNQYSDCDDRVALFYYLVKETYNLPMIAVLYPTHITIAVKFSNPAGESLTYKGIKYFVCDPTAQAKNLRIGQIPPTLEHTPFEVVYEYNPANR